MGNKSSDKCLNKKLCTKYYRSIESNTDQNFHCNPPNISADWYGCGLSNGISFDQIWYQLVFSAKRAQKSIILCSETWCISNFLKFWQYLVTAQLYNKKYDW